MRIDVQLSLTFRTYHDKIEKIEKKIPDKRNIGVYPIDCTTKPENNIEVNSATLIGIWSNPISTDTFKLFFVALTIIDSKKPISSPSARARAMKSTRK